MARYARSGKTMFLLPLILLGLSLSMDTLAVAISVGICKEDLRSVDALRVAVVFSATQSLMPFLGWLAGRSVLNLIQPVDHWIAFLLLAFIGGKMIVESWRQMRVDPEGRELECPRNPTSLRRLVILAIATSIDALAAGISLAVEQTSPAVAVPVIGVVTFAVSFTGVMLGRRLGLIFQRRACIVGGLVLFALGLKIVIESSIV